MGNIKLLKDDVQKWESKARALAHQIKAEKAKSENAVKAIDEISRAMDGALIEFVLKFGTAVGEDTYELIVPVPSHLGEYDVRTFRNDSSKTYTVRIEKKK